MFKTVIALICTIFIVHFSMSVHAQEPACDSSSTTCPIPVDQFKTSAQPTEDIAPKETTDTKPTVSSDTTSNHISDILSKKNWPVILGGFWVFGLLLSLTPCVLPVLLVLTSLLMSLGIEVSRERVLALSITYVLAMSATYAVAGIISAWMGVFVQVYFQQPWIIISLSIFLFLLALSLLDFYKIKLPASARQLLIRFNTARASNTYLGAAGMGIVATLLGSPCSAAPLIGALTFIAQTGKIGLGGMSLFFMGLGLGTPLIIISLIGGNMLPIMQNWQRGLQSFFGLMLIAVSILLISRVISPVWTMALWSALMILTSLYMGALKNTADEGAWKFWRMMSIMVLVYGVALFLGALIGNQNPLNPLALNPKSESAPAMHAPAFQIVNTNEELQKFLEISSAMHQPVILDFYASWCTVCKKMDSEIFQNASVQAAMANFMLLRVDLTDVHGNGMTLAKSMNVLAPPAVIFFDKSGKELPERVDGGVSADQFIQLLATIKNG